MGSSASGSSAGSRAEDRTPRELQRARDVRVTQPATQAGPIGKAADDFLMDVGLKAKTTDYYARLPERAAASRAANESMMRSSDDRPAPAPVAPATPPAPEPTAPAPTAPVTQPPAVETAQADLTLAVDELTMPAGERAARERAAGTPAMDLGTAAGAAAERAAAEQTATSEAEREAADALLKGRRSTILTTPGGLLAPAEEQTTRTRSLIGGRSRA
jgi:type IV secretory pathway VirB10-like protein